MFVLAGSLALNVVLGWKLGPWKSVRSPRSPAPEVGTVLPPLVVSDLQGRQQTISFRGGRSTVLYVFAPGCSWCRRNIANICRLSTSNAKAYRFIGLSLSTRDLDKYLFAYPHPFPVFVSARAELARALGLGVTPQTIVVTAEGKVWKNWLGAYDGEVQKEVEEYFGRRLPGIKSAPECWDSKGLAYSPGIVVSTDQGRVRCTAEGWTAVVATDAADPHRAAPGENRH
jgi:hypothetical protein